LFESDFDKEIKKFEKKQRR